MVQDIALAALEWDVVDLIESLEGYRIRGFFDPVPSTGAGDVAYLGPDASWSAVVKEIPDLKIALALDDPRIRARLFEHYGKDAIVTLRSRHAHVSPRATCGYGSIVQRGVTIMPNALLGT